jgi:hypothetical protein
MSRRRIVVAGIGLVALAAWVGGAMGKYASDDPEAAGRDFRLSERSGVASALDESQASGIRVTGSLGTGFDCRPMAPPAAAAGKNQLLTRAGERSESDAAPAVALPTAFAFGAARPNPVDRATTLSFDLPVASLVTLETFDLRGRRVIAAQAEELGPGRYQRTWKGLDDGGRALAPGVYLVRIEATALDGRPGLRAVRKLMLLR